MPLKAVIAAAAGILALGGFAFVWFAESTPIEVSSGTRVRHDDYAFILDRVALKTQTDGSRAVAVTLRVENDAKRVAYVWQASTAYAVDSAGRHYAADRQASSAARSIPAGERATVGLVYRVPADASDLHLAFWDGILMGDVLDGVRYARLRLPLQPTRPG